MKKRVKKLWLEALRSGEYKQGKEMLKNERGGYCCLGVLTDLYAKEKGVSFEKASQGHAATLNGRVVRWSGLKDAFGMRYGGVSLCHLNDKGKRFKTIANIIEAEF